MRLPYINGGHYIGEGCVRATHFSVHSSQTDRLTFSYRHKAHYAASKAKRSVLKNCVFSIAARKGQRAADQSCTKTEAREDERPKKRNFQPHFVSPLPLLRFRHCSFSRVRPLQHCIGGAWRRSSVTRAWKKKENTELKKEAVVWCLCLSSSLSLFLFF